MISSKHSLLVTTHCLTTCPLTRLLSWVSSPWTLSMTSLPQKLSMQEGSALRLASSAVARAPPLLPVESSWSCHKRKRVFALKGRQCNSCLCLPGSKLSNESHLCPKTAARACPGHRHQPLRVQRGKLRHRDADGLVHVPQAEGSKGQAASKGTTPSGAPRGVSTLPLLASLVSCKGCWCVREEEKEGESPSGFSEGQLALKCRGLGWWHCPH